VTELEHRPQTRHDALPAQAVQEHAQPREVRVKLRRELKEHGPRAAEQVVQLDAREVRRVERQPLAGREAG
jgi:hypothetical protein